MNLPFSSYPFCFQLSFDFRLFIDKCKKEGEYCDKTLFNPCCGDLTCVLTGFAKGT